MRLRSFLLVLAVVTFVVGCATKSTPPSVRVPWAEIESLHEGESVSRRFRVSGRCGSVPSGSRLMFVVETGKDVYSPKLPPASVTGDSFEGGANEYGVPTGGTFTLCVFLVSEEGFQHITDWHAQGKATGNYPPFRGSIPGGVPLARVKLRVAKA